MIHQIHLFRKVYFTLLLFILLFASLSSKGVETDCSKKPNPYKLEIINCFEDYQKQISENPNFELIDLEKLIPTIVLDIRYATNNNFTEKVIYTMPKAFLRKPVAMALLKVQDSLSKLKLGLKIFDAYRPYAATLKFFEIYPDTNFVADPRYGSRHNRGAAVDLTLIDLNTKKEINMPTRFDDFSEKAHPDYMNFSDEVLKNRALLFNIMSYFGFTHYPTEWWHFDFNNWQSFPLLDLTFEELLTH
jgi:D-alanyl-D-alanine dipeptidase